MGNCRVVLLAVVVLQPLLLLLLLLSYSHMQHVCLVLFMRFFVHIFMGDVPSKTGYP